MSEDKDKIEMMNDWQTEADNRIEKLELQIKNSPSNFNLHNMIKDLKGEMEEFDTLGVNHNNELIFLRKEISELKEDLEYWGSEIVQLLKDQNNIKSVLKEYNDLIIETLSSEISGESVDYLIKEANNLFKQLEDGEKEEVLEGSIPNTQDAVDQSSYPDSKPSEPSDDLYDEDIIWQGVYYTKVSKHTEVCNKLISEFLDDWSFIIEKLNGYFYKMKRDQLKPLEAKVMIGFFLESRRKKWQKRAEK